MDAPDWPQLADPDLLERRIASLALKIEGTAVGPLVAQLHAELAAKNLAFFPSCHVGDEWFVPVGIPAIFVPFFLVHDRLRALEKTMMLEVEGGTPEWFMRLIRHEAAHAFAYAFALPEEEKWREIFGETSADDTPDFYRPRPYSRSYVVHLDDWYAQAHPDEDFAETFAVWLTPGLDWRARYRGWKALAKLEYVEARMQALAGQPARHAPAFRVAEYDCLNVKLKTYYARKRKQFADTYPDFYDNDLRALFPTAPAPSLAAMEAGKQEIRKGHAGVVTAPRIKASSYLRARRRRLMNSICQWTNERRYRVDRLLDRLIARCDQLALAAANDDPQQDFRISAYLTTQVMNYLFTGKFKRTK